MEPLSEADADVLKVICDGPEACRRAAVIAWELGLGLTVTAEYLHRLEVKGLLECWKPRLNPHLELWTLSPFGAELMHVHTIETGPAEVWRWDRDGHDEPPVHVHREGRVVPDLVSVLGLEAPVAGRTKGKSLVS